MPGGGRIRRDDVPQAIAPTWIHGSATGQHNIAVELAAYINVTACNLQTSSVHQIQGEDHSQNTYRCIAKDTGE